MAARILIVAPARPLFPEIVVFRCLVSLWLGHCYAKMTDAREFVEKSPIFNDMLFPNNMGHLQRVHTVHGYSALQPASLFHWPLKEPPPPELLSDFVYRSEHRGQKAGELTQVTADGISRLRCAHRTVTITGETMNTLTVSVEPGPADTLTRTDTFYRGWRAQLNGKLIPLESGTSPFSTVQLPESETSSIIFYTHRPSFAVATTSLTVVAVIVIITAGWAFRSSKRDE